MSCPPSNPSVHTSLPVPLMPFVTPLKGRYMPLTYATLKLKTYSHTYSVSESLSHRSTVSLPALTRRKLRTHASSSPSPPPFPPPQSVLASPGALSAPMSPHPADASDARHSVTPSNIAALHPPAALTVNPFPPLLFR